MARVSLKNDYESFDRLLNRFKKAVDKDNIVRIYCERQEYKKPSHIRKTARAVAIKRHHKLLRDENKKIVEMRLQSKAKVSNISSY